MEIFNGKREQNFDQSETGSSNSQTRISNKPEKAEQLARDAQSKFGGREIQRGKSEDRR